MGVCEQELGRRKKLPGGTWERGRVVERREAQDSSLGHVPTSRVEEGNLKRQEQSARTYMIGVLLKKKEKG